MTTSDSRSSGYLGQSRRSPTGLAIVIGLHGAALAVALLAKTGMVQTYVNPDPPTVFNVPPNTPPPDPRTESVEPADPPPISAATPSPIPVPPFRTIVEPTEFPLPPLPTAPIVDPIPAPEPVVRGAVLRSRSSAQPAYPSIMLRQELEGSCTIRVRIAPNGRVTEAIPMDATHPAFCAATERHALRRWRFEPATRDGVPVESWQQHIVQFPDHLIGRF